jgi:hypothetical protein
MYIHQYLVLGALRLRRGAPITIGHVPAISKSFIRRPLDSVINIPLLDQFDGTKTQESKLQLYIYIDYILII